MREFRFKGGALRRFALAAAVVLCATGGIRPAAAETVLVGTVSNSSDVPFFIAQKLGYFRQEGLDVKLLPFGSASKMVAPLGSGQLDVGAGAPSAGLYNAYARGVGIRIVADKGSCTPGHGHQALLVRKDLVDSGRFKSFKDLKGLKVAGNGAGNANTASLSIYLQKGGLSMADAKIEYIDFPQHVMALSNKAIDASVTTEPFVTYAVQKGVAVRIAGDDVVYPNHQLSVLLYGNDFIKNHPETAKKFMVAYLKAVRFYNGALKNGHLAGPNANAVIGILTEFTPLKDANVYRSAVVPANNPDGHVNMASLKKDYEFFKAHKWLTGNAPVESVVDNTFVDAALKELGPYKPAR